MILKKTNLLDYSIFLEKNTLSKYLSSSGENFQIKVFYEDIEKVEVPTRVIIFREERGEF